MTDLLDFALEAHGGGTRSRFMSSIRLRNDIAVVGGDRSSALHVAIK